MFPAFLFCFAVNRWLHDVRGLSSLEMKVWKVKPVFLEKRVELEIEMPEMRLEGGYQVDQASFEADLTTTTGQFRLMLYNLTGVGMAFLDMHKMEEKTLHVDNVEMDYSVEGCGVNMSKNTTDTELLNYLNNETICDVLKSDVLESKLMKDLSYHLNVALMSRVNQVLTEGDLGPMIENQQVLMKLQNYVYENTENINDVLDAVIDSVKSLIVEKLDDKLSLPNIDETFKIWIIKGRFTAFNGHVSGISSLRRAGDASLSVHYKRYVANLLGLRPSGLLTAWAGPINIYIHLMADWDQNNKLSLEEFKIEELGGLTVSVTGLGWLFNDLASRIVTWVLGLYQETIVSRLEKLLRDYIVQIFADSTLEDLITGKAFKGLLGI
uniref:Uncharacterized protein n=1 Tax=Timema bartmani TaxID=61472 RepID=A0A7R9I1V0_9NEOP|nr:unnamed protein product [Timema bartmani]